MREVNLLLAIIKIEIHRTLKTFKPKYQERPQTYYIKKNKINKYLMQKITHRLH